MAKVFTSRSGKTVVLFNPNERAQRYCEELHTHCNIFTGNPLTSTQAAYRIGVLNERKVQAKVYCKQHNLKSKSKFYKRGK